MSADVDLFGFKISGKTPIERQQDVCTAIQLYTEKFGAPDFIWVRDPLMIPANAPEGIEFVVTESAPVTAVTMGQYGRPARAAQPDRGRGGDPGDGVGGGGAGRARQITRAAKPQRPPAPSARS